MPDLPPPVVHAAAPLRVDLAGSGGLPTLALGQPASALTVTLALAAHVEIRLGGRTIQLRAADGEHVTLDSPAGLVYDGHLDEHKAALNMLPVTGGVEMLTGSDAPRAPGLGSRTATCVAMLAALARCRREAYDGPELAGLAVSLEEAELGRHVSRLDAWCVALGGVGLLSTDGDQVTAHPGAPDGAAQELAARAALVALDRSRAGGVRRSAVVQALAAGDPATTHAVRVLEEMVQPAADALRSGAWERLAEVFDASWAAQQQLDAVLSAAPARTLLDRLRAAGARAWKVTSGQRGGALLVLCEPECRNDVGAAARECGCTELAAAPGAGVRIWEEEASA